MAASPAFAAPPDLKLTSDKPKPAAGDLVRVSAETPAKAVKWKVIGDCQYAADTSGRIVYVVVKSGKVSVIAVAASDVGELSEFAECVLVVDGPGPGPGPDPLVMTVRTALAEVETAQERMLLGNLKTFYGKAAIAAVDPAILTWGALNDRLTTLSQAEGTAGKLKPVQAAIAQVLVVELPSKNATDQPLDQAGRDKAVAVFTRISNAIGEVSK